MKYTFTPGQRLSIAGAGDFFRILGTTSPVDVEFYFQGREIAERLEVEAGFAESFRTIEFDRVDITSPLAQTVQFETARGSEIRYDRGAATISGSVDLNAATLAALEQINVRPEAATGFYNTAGALAANTADTIFTAAANMNGAILLTASAYDQNSQYLSVFSFIAKASAPASNTDGQSLLDIVPKAHRTSDCSASGELNEAQFIPAGMGLYFIGNYATGVGHKRTARYKLL